MTQHDPWRASALAWRTGGDDNGLVGALQPLDLLIKLSDARSRSGIQRVAECLLSSRDRPSFAAVATAGIATTGLMHRSKTCAVLARSYSIISSARACSVSGTVSPSALAVLRLSTNSNFVGCSTGKSAGLEPFKILST
jgi:hypothetical protein